MDERDILENKYKFYLLVREIGCREVRIIGFNTDDEAIAFINKYKDRFVIYDKLRSI